MIRDPAAAVDATEIVRGAGLVRSRCLVGGVEAGRVPHVPDRPETAQVRANSGFRGDWRGVVRSFRGGPVVLRPA